MPPDADRFRPTVASGAGSAGVSATVPALPDWIRKCCCAATVPGQGRGRLLRHPCSTCTGRTNRSGSTAGGRRVVELDEVVGEARRAAASAPSAVDLADDEARSERVGRGGSDGRQRRHHQRSDCGRDESTPRTWTSTRPGIEQCGHRGPFSRLTWQGGTDAGTRALMHARGVPRDANPKGNPGIGSPYLP